MNYSVRRGFGDCDWPEGAANENGKYLKTCTNCGVAFMGYSHRTVCRICAIGTAKQEDSHSLTGASCIRKLCDATLSRILRRKNG